MVYCVIEMFGEKGSKSGDVDDVKAQAGYGSDVVGAIAMQC